jgi:hypothetical protein
MRDFREWDVREEGKKHETGRRSRCEERKPLEWEGLSG